MYISPWVNRASHIVLVLSSGSIQKLFELVRIVATGSSAEGSSWNTQDLCMVAERRSL